MNISCIERLASPAPKARKTLANETVNKAYANGKNGVALGVRVNAIVGHWIQLMQQFQS